VTATNGVYQCNEWQYCVLHTAERERERETGHEIFTRTYARHVSLRPKEEGTKWCDMLKVAAV
jgi:hypothetical protein